MDDRKSYIGGSDCAAVLGLSRWRTPLSVWASKTGAIEDEDISGKLAVKLGNRLESVVVELFEEATGKKAHRVNETITHPQYPFIRANIDRRIVGEDAILEVKTASGWKAKEWGGEDIPQEYLLQVMHYLAVTGKQIGYIAVLIGGNQDFIWKPVIRDEEVIKNIVEKEVHFWNTFVVPKVMPGIITRNDGDVLFKLFPQDDGKEIQLDDEACKLIESRQSMLADLKLLEGNLDKTDNEIKVKMQEATIGLAGKYKVSWKSQTTKRLDSKRLKDENPELYAAYSKDSISRPLNIKELKEKK
jgi:putative phage-type endonuclease